MIQVRLTSINSLARVSNVETRLSDRRIPVKGDTGQISTGIPSGPRPLVRGKRPARAQTIHQRSAASLGRPNHKMRSVLSGEPISQGRASINHRPGIDKVNTGVHQCKLLNIYYKVRLCTVVHGCAWLCIECDRTSQMKVKPK